MKSSNIIWILGIIVIVGLIGWFVFGGPSPLSNTGGFNATSTTSTATTSGSTGTTAPTTTGSSASLGEMYTNTAYGFSFSYPKALNAQSFDNFMQLNQNDWRYGVTQANRGTPVISVPVIEFSRGNGIATGQPYPLFYTSQVRIGVSPDTAQCYAKNEGYTNQTITNVTIHGVTWKKFIFGDAATMKYVRGASYRTIHNNKCYGVETIENGSSYRDDTMKPGYSDAQLKAFFNQATAIAMTFRFTK